MSAQATAPADGAAPTADPLQLLAALTRAVAQQPHDAALWSRIGFQYLKLGDHQEALDNFRAAQQLDVTHADAWFGETVALFELGRHAAALDAVGLAIARSPRDQRLWSARAHILAALGAEPADVTRAYRDWARRFADPLAPREPAPATPAAGRRLRVGYLSGDFRQHALSYFFLPVLRCHDRSRFELFGFHSGLADTRTPDFAGQFEHFLTVDRQNDEETAAAIAACRLDVLVDLSGHTDGNRLLALARRPAPRQLTWYGYNCTTGMGAIDGRLTDATMDPPGNEVWSSETLLRLPAFAAYEPPASDLPPPSALPATRCGHITFGSLNNAQKLTTATLEAWAALLAAVPDSRLLLIAPYGPGGEAANRPAFLRRLTDCGLPADRLDLLPRLPLDDFMRLGERIDIALESFPFSGGVTTCHALWMGLPAVTLAGVLPFTRAAAAVLTAAGLPELIADTPDAYRQIAADLAVDRQRLAKMRDGLRQRLQQSPLFDHAGQTRALEALYLAGQATR